MDHSLATAYDFLQIPYLSGKMASAINGDWDSAWYLWAEVAESQLGKECDIAAGVEQIVKSIRQDARKGDDPWSDQQRADYGAVALFYFTRDYRRWREKWPNAEVRVPVGNRVSVSQRVVRERHQPPLPLLTHLTPSKYDRVDGALPVSATPVPHLLLALESVAPMRAAPRGLRARAGQRSHSRVSFPSRGS